MISSLKAWWWRQQFHPGCMGFLANPFWLTRRGLRRAIAVQIPMLGEGKILDFGCGAKPYRQMFSPTSDYIGVDLENSGHDHRNERIDVLYDGQTLPFLDCQFDAIFSSEVMEHVFVPERITAELYRVLKPGGRLLLTVPFSWAEHEAPWDYARYTSFGMRALLERHGFRIVALEKTGNDFQAIGQLAAASIYSRLGGSVKLRALYSVVLCAPCMVIGAVLGFLLGNRQHLYLNVVILAERPLAEGAP